jgi:hypothetical protein
MAPRSRFLQLRYNLAERDAWRAAAPVDVPLSRWIRRTLNEAAMGAPAAPVSPQAVPARADAPETAGSAPEAAQANARLLALLEAARG